MHGYNGLVDSVNLFKAMADPTRLRVVALLVNRGPEVCVCDITSALEQPQSTVSRQLAVLRQLNIVVARRDGLWIHYSLAEANSPLHVAVLQALAATTAVEPRLKADLKRFDRLKRKGDLACCSPQTPNAQKSCTSAPPSRKEKALA